MRRVGFFELVLFYGKQKSLSYSTLRSCITVFTLPQKLRKREWEGLHAFWLHRLWCKRGGGGLDVYEQNWSHRIKFFTNLSKVCPPTWCIFSGTALSWVFSNGLQSFRNGLLPAFPQTGTPARKTSPVWAPFRGLQFLPGTPVCGLYGLQLLSECVHLLQSGAFPLLFHWAWCLQSCWPYVSFVLNSFYAAICTLS